MIIIVISLLALPNQNKVDLRRGEKTCSIHKAVENIELMHECCLKHVNVGTARLKQHIQDKETEEVEKQNRANMERIKQSCDKKLAYPPPLDGYSPT